MQTESLELALFFMVAKCFDHYKSLLGVNPPPHKYLASMTSSSTCPVSELKSVGLRVCDTHIILHLVELKCIPHVLPSSQENVGIFAG